MCANRRPTERQHVMPDATRAIGPVIAHEAVLHLTAEYVVIEAALAPRPRTFFRMSRSILSPATSFFNRPISACSGFITPLPRNACCGSLVSPRTFDSNWTIDFVMKRPYAVFQYRLVYPPALNWTRLSRLAEDVIEPIRHAKGGSGSLCRRIKVRRHPGSNTDGSEPDIQDVSAIARQRVTTRGVRDSDMMGPRELCSVVRLGNKALNSQCAPKERFPQHYPER